jgi:hypothetical protein
LSKPTDESGEEAFNAKLNDRNLEGHEWFFAMLLKGRTPRQLSLLKTSWPLHKDGSLWDILKNERLSPDRLTAVPELFPRRRTNRVSVSGWGNWHTIPGAMDQQSYLTLQLVRICKRYQRKAMARDTVIGKLLDDTPEMRAALTQKQAIEMIAAADDGAALIVDQEFAELEQALLGGIDFLPALQQYLDKNL